MKVTKKVIASGLLGLALFSSSILYFLGRSDRSVAYKRAKKVMDPDLYLVYRLSERLLDANSIKRSLRVAVRRGAECEGSLGLKSDSAKCAAAQYLPDIDKSTNFDIWASQVVNTMAGSANAQASSISGTIFINIPMLKELMGKPEQVACVLAHELAHVTQNHSEEKIEQQNKYDLIAASRISQKMKKLRQSQNTGYAMAAFLGGMSAAYSGDNSSLNNLNNQIAMNNLASQIAEPQITAMAMQYSPQVGEAINTMKGLSPAYMKQGSKYINAYLRDASLALTAFGRGLEYEADLLGVEYIARAGLSPKSCVKMWTETMPHDTNKVVARLLPEGTKDPGTIEPSIFINKEKEPKVEAYDPKCTPVKRRSGSCGKSKRNKELNTVHEDVIELLRTHPSDERRAKALKQHISDKKLFNDFKKEGKIAIKNKYMRDWVYDKESNSVVISDLLKSPTEVGLGKTGTTGIDVDQFFEP